MNTPRVILILHIFVFISSISPFIDNSIKSLSNSKSNVNLKFWGFQNCPYFWILPSRGWNKDVRSPFNFFFTVWKIELTPGVFNLNYLSFYLAKKVRTVLNSWKHSDLETDFFWDTVFISRNDVSIIQKYTSSNWESSDSFEI